VELDEKILAVFIVDSTEKMQEIFIAKDADINRFTVESVKSTLDLKLETKTQIYKAIIYGIFQSMIISRLSEFMKQYNHSGSSQEPYSTW
jgi:hypothetical protein